MTDRDDEDLQRRIRKRAYQLWEQEGRPEGRANAHWDMAAELVAIEENQRLAMKPVSPPSATGPTGEPIEPLPPAESMGDLPTLVDQGEERTVPQEEESPAVAPLDTDAEVTLTNKQGDRAAARSAPPPKDGTRQRTRASSGGDAAEKTAKGPASERARASS